ncbi:MAG TPA: N-acetylglucosamine-6-phosphate deacetylase [Planctomycetes bacterium]|nr:N-acetylglucosamine-6-phosphate deacetylase [Planctomycetota bacterium]
MRTLHGRMLVDGELRVGRITLRAGRIGSVELEDTPPHPELAEDLPILAPGLIDLHVHGFRGADPVRDLPGMARALAAEGTTAFLPTLFPDDPARLGETAEEVWGEARRIRCSPAAGLFVDLPEGETLRTNDATLATPLGLHLEGPFVNPLSAGSLPPERLVEPSPAALREILGSATGDGRGIRTMTLAPELPGALELVKELEASGVRVSLGHSRALSDQAVLAAKAGARGVTHLYNAMSGVHHREMGLAGFALTEDCLVAELIGDLVHVGPEAVDLALRARGPRGLAIVSDALAGAGTGCSTFESHGHTCREHAGAFWFDDPEAPGGRRLAGAAASQLEAVRRLTRAGVLSVAEALTMASETPARALGIEDERGRLAAGLVADVLVLDANLGIIEVVC